MISNTNNYTFPEALIECYIFPLFHATSSEELVTYMTFGTIIYGIITFFMPFPAPYGRYNKTWAGFGIPAKIAWCLQESPSFYIPLIMAYHGIRNESFKSFILFLYGMHTNLGSDGILRDLRKGNQTNYLIPKDGLFKYISCANYFGEIVEMWGYALASLSAPAAAHALFTTLFLSRRAIQHHQWYLKKFDDYPKNRKAVIPFIL